ncbi:hypothetical protein WJX73_010063 [Symbiochloris irregularis]|uniref:mannan endo-1,4-beta-mannosidase n=1 Tax=Symbiochloris irregularis TaxID=706552 RepID=A0AAW1PV30_9CHLO
MMRSVLMLAAVAIDLLASRTAALRQLAAAPAQAQAPSGDYFVQVGSGLDFEIGCDKFFPAIWNQWEVIEAGAGAPFLLGASLPPGVTGPELLRNQMARAAAAGLNTMRIWGQAVDPMYQLQTSPGVYNELIFSGLDYALDQARQHNIKIVIAFIDNWNVVEGVPKYVAWTNNSALNSSDFFTDPQIMQWYQNHVKTLITRVNTINGYTYSEDPTIFAWELINEPRCQYCANGTIATWVDTMAAYVKTLDKNHLLTVGEEGFWSTTASQLLDNPIYEPGGSNWAPTQGQDFLADHSSPNIDFSSFHLWIDNWNTVRPDFPPQWIASHVRDGAILKKPVLLEEFGKWVNATANSSIADRNTYFKIILDTAFQYIANGSALKGAGFWQFYAPGQIGPANEGLGEGLYGILPTDQAFLEFSDFAEKLAAFNTPDPSCQLPAPAPIPKAQNCSSTEVRGLPGTGYEGPTCSQDIDDQTASYQGPLICDVAYPHLAPGFIFDPTGALNSTASNSSKQLGVGNPAPVNTLEDCLIACESAPGCSSVTFSASAQNCFLKGCPSNNTVTCSTPPPPGSPGGINGPPELVPGPPAPAAPPCNLAPYLCPLPSYIYVNYYSIARRESDWPHQCPLSCCPNMHNSGQADSASIFASTCAMYNPECTTLQANPGIALSPSGVAGKELVNLPSGYASVPVPGIDLAFAPSGTPAGGALQQAAQAPSGSATVEAG